MSPGHKRQIAEEFVSGERCTARAACRHFGLHRSTFGYKAKEPDAWLAKLKCALRRMSNQHLRGRPCRIVLLGACRSSKGLNERIAPKPFIILKGLLSSVRLIFDHRFKSDILSNC